MRRLAALVRAVLDHFSDVDEATLMGMSLGGGLVMPPPESRGSGAWSFSTCSTTSGGPVSQSPPTPARIAGRTFARIEPLIAHIPGGINRVLAARSRRSLDGLRWGMW